MTESTPTIHNVKDKMQNQSTYRKPGKCELLSRGKEIYGEHQEGPNVGLTDTITMLDVLKKICLK